MALGAESSAAAIPASYVTAPTTAAAVGSSFAKVSTGVWTNAATISLTSGTWLVIGRAALGNVSDNSVPCYATVAFRNGSTVLESVAYRSDERGTDAGYASTGTGKPISLHGFITVASTTSITLDVYWTDGNGTAVSGSDATYGDSRMVAIRLNGGNALGTLSSTATTVGNLDYLNGATTTTQNKLANYYTTYATLTPPANATVLALGNCAVNTGADEDLISVKLTKDDSTIGGYADIGGRGEREIKTVTTADHTIPLHGLTTFNGSESLKLAARSQVNRANQNYLSSGSRLSYFVVGGDATLGNAASSTSLDSRRRPATTFASATNPSVTVSTTITQAGDTLTPTTAGVYLTICTYTVQSNAVRSDVRGRLLKNSTVVDRAVAQTGETSEDSQYHTVQLFNISSFDGSTDTMKFQINAAPGDGGTVTLQADYQLDMVKL